MKARRSARSGARVLLRLPNWIGDAVQCEPVLRALLARPALELSLCAPRKVLALFEASYPDAARLCGERRPEDPALWRGHDLALLFTNSFASAWCAWLAGIPERVGWARDLRSWCLTEAMTPALERGAPALGRGRAARWPRLLPRPFAMSALELAQLAGITVRDTRPRLRASARGRESAAQRLREAAVPGARPFALLTAGSRPESAKAPPVELWSALARELLARSELPLLACAAPGEQASLEALRAVLEPALRSRLHFACDVGFDELLALAEGCAWAVCADGGARHLCAAAGARVLVLHGPTDARHSASHFDPRLVVEASVPCGPCHRERCPQLGAQHLACWRTLAPRAALDALLGG